MWLQAGLGSHCRRALAPAPAPELSSTHSLAPAPALQLFNKQVVNHLVFKSFLRQTIPFEQESRLLIFTIILIKSESEYQEI